MTRREKRKQYSKKYYAENLSELKRKAGIYRNKNRKKLNKTMREWYTERGGRKVKREWRWMSEYGLSPSDVRSLRKLQKYGCAICGVKKDRDSRWGILNIDHEHTGLKRVRGLLCTFCNRILGMLEKRQKLLKLCSPFYNYIDSPPAKKLQLKGWMIEDEG